MKEKVGRATINPNLETQGTGAPVIYGSRNFLALSINSGAPKASLCQSLELQPGRELDDARILGCRVLAELRVDLGSGGIELAGEVNGAELGMIERVVELGAELKV